MKILLVYCNLPLEFDIPLGVSSLSACLKQYGHDVRLFETGRYKDPSGECTRKHLVEVLQVPPYFYQSNHYLSSDLYDDFIKTVKEYDPDVIGFSVVEATYRQFISLLKRSEITIQQSKALVVVGGVQAIIAPELFQLNSIDAICVGEGEIAFCNLCETLQQGKDITTSKGFWIKERSSGEWTKNQHERAVNLDKLPYMDFDIFPTQYKKSPQKEAMAHLEASRGCNYACSFCSDSVIKKVFKKNECGSWFRNKGIAGIQRDLAHIDDKVNPRFLSLKSPCFLNFNLTRTREFVEVYREFSYPMWFFMRPEDVSREKFSILRELDCDIRISIGLEHGNEDFRRKHLNRGYTNKQFLDACDILSDFGIIYTVNFIYGFPHETLDLVFDTVAVVRATGNAFVSAFRYCPMRGSPMRDYCIKHDMIDRELIADGLAAPYYLNNTYLSEQDVLGIGRTLMLYIFLDGKYYPLIDKALQFTSEGNRAFDKLKEEYYNMRGW